MVGNNGATTSQQFFQSSLAPIINFGDYDEDLIQVTRFVGLGKKDRLTIAQRNELREKMKKDTKMLFMIQQALGKVIFI